MQQRIANLPPAAAHFGERVSSRLAELIEAKHVTGFCPFARADASSRQRPAPRETAPVLARR
eukprot:3632579-Pyramimonas_sp.AAC.1